MAPQTPNPAVPEASAAPTPTTSSSTPSNASASPSASPSPSTSAPFPEFPKLLQNDPKRTGYDPQKHNLVNYFRVLTGKMTDEGQYHWREALGREYEARDCARCEGFRDWAFAHSPTVRFMRERVEELNGTLDERNVLCRRCPARMTEDGAIHRQSGGFSPDHGILICSNVLRDRYHLEDTLAHEMIHAWDHLRWKVDWVGDKDLKHAACTEIRASMLSGECRWSREAWTRGNWTLTQQFQDCVRKRAIQSVMARPRCKDDVQAAKVVNQVWDSCFADTRPFDEVYR